MNFIYRTFISLLALAAIGQGAPKSKDVAKAEDKPTERYRPTPYYLCVRVYKGFYSRYYLIGEEWPVHEWLIFDGATGAPGCHLTNWRFQEVTNPVTGGVTFNCTFDLPVLCQERVQKSINNYLGFAPANGINTNLGYKPASGEEPGGIYCPEITEPPELKQLFKDIGERRKSCTWYDGPGAHTCEESEQ